MQAGRTCLALLFALGLLAGCSVGPKYVPPVITTPAAWQDAVDGVAIEPVDPEVLVRWWTTLDDPVLTDLIQRAARANLDLKKAGAVVREARARRGLSQADAYPTLDATGSAKRSRSPRTTGGGSTQNLYAVGFDASWELDIFGGVRRSVEAADATIEASQEALRDVLVSLLAEVATNYIAVRTSQARLALTESNLESQAETLDLTRMRWEAGLTTALDVEQATYAVESTRAQLPTLRAGMREAMNSLALLLGEAPGRIQTELQESRPIPVASPAVVVGVPADLLRRRPDIRQAERKLAAQTAQIGVATAELYPKFTLSGTIGLSASSLAGLFSVTNRSLGLGPSFSWRLFDAGSVRRNIEVQTALQEQYAVAYETAVLTALKEVETALTAYAEEQRHREILQGAVQAARRAVELAESQYAAGTTDFRSVLEAQRSLLSYQDQLAQSDGAVTTDLVKVYKTLGGGWAPQDDDAP